MPQPTADCNLLFGILALQMDFIQRDALIAAMHAWVLDKSKPLGQVLREQGQLAEDEYVLLEGLVRKHLVKHNNDPQQSLAALSPVGPVRHDLQQIADADVQASVARVSSAPLGEEATAAYVADTSSTHGRFLILRPHARGGLGEVFVARDEELHREVALKEIQQRHADNPESRARFLLEAEVTGGLEHPGIVPVYGLGSYADGRPFYAMRFIRGDSLADAITAYHRDKQRLPQGERLLRLRQLLGRLVDVCQAVAYAHSRGVLHRDLKPGNVMLGRYGETLVVDWGLAKVLGQAEVETTEGAVRPGLSGDSAMTRTGAALGTPAYMSPEQAAGQLDRLGPASDVYSLGGTLYCLLTGRAPFTGNDVGAVLGRVQKGEFPRPRELEQQVPAALEAICLKAMATRPADRYATPDEMAGEIERWLADEPVRAHREPLSARLGRWVRRHQPVVAGAGALLLTAVVALVVGNVLVGDALHREQEANRKRVLGLVDQLQTAAAPAVPTILTALQEQPEAVRPLLEQRWQELDAADRKQERMRVGLALLPSAPDTYRPVLAQWLSDESIEPAEFLVVRDALATHAGQVNEPLWQIAENETLKPPARFRALAALAAFDRDSPRWQPPLATLAVEQMMQSNPLFLGVWTQALQPAEAHLLAPLTEVFRGEAAETRKVASSILAVYAAKRPEKLADLLANADPVQVTELWQRAVQHRAKLVELLEAEVKRTVPPDTAEPKKIAQARRQSNAAALLVRLGRAEPTWPLLKQTPTPNLRSHLVQKLQSLGVEAATVVRQLEQEPDVSARRTLIVALGEYGGEQLPAPLREKLVPMLLQGYRDDPDPGIHGAIDWLLRHRQEGPERRPLDWGQAKALDAIDRERAGQAPGPRRWLVNGQGQTYTAVEGPVEFRMGSPLSEPDRLADREGQHVRHIPRSFAVAVKPVTVAQWEEFRKAYPRLWNHNIEKYSPERDCPVVAITWFDAAQYCRWLSEKEGVPEEQMCYPPVEEIAKSQDGLTPLYLPADYLGRTGYRLPTEAEWEYTCRAGTATAHSYGGDEVLLGQHAWYFKNSQNRTWPVGQKRPNDLGLFDLHGNVWQWCQDEYMAYPEHGEAIREITDRKSLVLRGGSFLSHPANVRSAYRDLSRPTYRGNAIGFRPARTLASGFFTILRS